MIDYIKSNIIFAHQPFSFSMKSLLVFFSVQNIEKYEGKAVIFLPAHPESCTHIFALGLTF